MTREDAILCLKGIKNYGRDTFTSKSQGDWQESLDMAIEALEKEPKTGHWILIDDEDENEDERKLFMAKCSECGEIVDSRMISKYPYCHCGAKMVEPQES